MGAKTSTVNMPVVAESDVVFVAVKPGVVPTVLNDVKSIASGKLFISVAMGISIKQIETVSIFCFMQQVVVLENEKQQIACHNQNSNRIVFLFNFRFYRKTQGSFV